MAKMTEEFREEFLAKTRYGYLTTLTRDGAPRTVPLWFDWDGHIVRIFSGIGSPKIKRIKHDARITLLVSNDMSEGEMWVAFDGSAEIKLKGVMELIEQLAARYWDLSNPKLKATLDSWKATPEQFCMIELVPTRIRTMVE
ncbi:pyridoxamine 5'-phosphate oxidase family protein [Anaerolineales bacterium HSG6]|nr:pyridoxamine 5'-phosphate oxidase family protein [Anaerolineales bacterium HSG6]